MSVQRPADLERQVRSSLAQGQIVVLESACPDSLAGARDTSRRLSAWIATLGDFGVGRISRSATLGLAVVAADAHAPVGIDVEAIGSEGRADHWAADVLHRDERVSLEGLTHLQAAAIWTRKEASLKAFGVGLAIEPASLLTGPYNEHWQQLSHPTLGTATLCSLAAPAGFALALATLRASRAQVARFTVEL